MAGKKPPPQDSSAASDEPLGDKAPSKPKATPKQRAKKPRKPRKPNARKTIRSPAIDKRIFDSLAQGIDLETICLDSSMPASRTVRSWVEQDEAFAADIAHARESWMAAIDRQILQIADTLDAADMVEEEVRQVGSVKTIIRRVKRAVDRTEHRKLRIHVRSQIQARYEVRRREKLAAEARRSTNEAIQAAATIAAAAGGVAPDVNLIVTNLVTAHDEQGDIGTDGAADAAFALAMELRAAAIKRPTMDEDEDE
jgi:hypothetical protein